MALARKIKTAGLTDEESTLKLLNAVIPSGCSSTKVDVVFDVYHEISNKNAELAHGNIGNFEFNKIAGFHLMIKQCSSFLSLANNKTELIKCIVAEWKRMLIFPNKLIYVTCEEECFFIFEGNCSTANHLFSTQEEADY